MHITVFGYIERNFQGTQMICMIITANNFKIQTAVTLFQNQLKLFYLLQHQTIKSELFVDGSSNLYWEKKLYSSSNASLLAHPWWIRGDLLPVFGLKSRLTG